MKLIKTNLCYSIVGEKDEFFKYNGYPTNKINFPLDAEIEAIFEEIKKENKPKVVAAPKKEEIVKNEDKEI
jgi:hypothetical protein